MDNVNGSVLTSIKKMLGITEEDEQFDLDITIDINTVFATLQQLGVGPKEGFSISDKSTTWSDYLGGYTNKLFEQVKTYMYLKVKLMFDPPTSSAITDIDKQLINEYEFRIIVATKENENLEKTDE